MNIEKLERDISDALVTHHNEAATHIGLAAMRELLSFLQECPDCRAPLKAINTAQVIGIACGRCGYSRGYDHQTKNYFTEHPNLPR